MPVRSRPRDGGGTEGRATARSKGPQWTAHSKRRPQSGHSVQSGPTTVVAARNAAKTAVHFATVTGIEPRHDWTPTVMPVQQGVRP